MVMLDPPDHTAFRRLVSAGFTPRRVAVIEPAVRAFVVERLEQLRGMPEAGPEEEWALVARFVAPSVLLAPALQTSS